jgi:hypothetical protein
MALGKYAVDYEAKVDYDRLRKERLTRAKDQNKYDAKLIKEVSNEKSRD